MNQLIVYYIPNLVIHCINTALLIGVVLLFWHGNIERNWLLMVGMMWMISAIMLGLAKRRYEEKIRRL